jgi:hypothetical protein
MVAMAPVAQAVPAGSVKATASLVAPALPASAGHQLGWQAGSSPGVAVAPDGSWLIAFQANDGTLWTRSSSGAFGRVGGAAHTVMQGTSPSVVAMPSGGFEIAYQTGDGMLGTVSPTGVVSGLGLGMAPGTSPSIAVAPDGSWEIAFQANDVTLWTRSSSGAGGRVGGGAGLAMMPGTSPSLVALPSGGFEIAYQTSDGVLGTVSPSGAVAGLGLGMWAGTSPSIAVAPDGSWEIAFQANDGTLWTRSSSGAGGRVGGGAGHAVMPGTSPAIVALASGFQIVYQTTDGLLGGVSPSGAVSGLGVQTWATGSPSVAASGSGFVTAFQVNSGNLGVRDAQGSGTDLGLGMPLSFSVTTASKPADFVHAITTGGAIVHVAGDVDLDLSGLDTLRVASGVQLLGDRRVVPAGPRLFTTTFPKVLLTAGSTQSTADNVRISGLRLDGGESTDPFSAVDQPDADGIQVHSSLNVEIDHNEIYGWRGAAVAVSDEQNRIGLANADTDRIHDNFIHHNQHPTGNVIGGGHGAGYGVGTFNGAYALIERNVFDVNRHDVTSDGRDGSGYLFYRNLILPHGGVNTQVDTTQAIDVHGRDTCGAGVAGDFNCGPAGEYFDVQFNTIDYVNGDSIHLRGIPSMTMDVENNVFADPSKDHALEENFPGTVSHYGVGNTFGKDPFAAPATTADFDGDGQPDRFLATGAGLWYQSSAMPVAHPEDNVPGGRFVFLGQSTAPLSGIHLRDVNGDGRTDVVVDGGPTLITPPVGASPAQPPATGPQVPDVRGETAAKATSDLQAAGYPVQTQQIGDCTHPAGSVTVQDQPPGIPVATRRSDLHPQVVLGIATPTGC